MPHQAIWSGYQLTHEDFQIELVTSLPSIRSHCEKTLKREPNLIECVSAMMKWRRNLPQRYRDKVPYMMIRYHPAKKFDGILLPRVASHVLFAYREIPYRRRAQIQPGHRGYTRLSEPTEDERALLNIFVRIIRKEGGTADPAKFEWTFMINTDQIMGNPLL